MIPISNHVMQITGHPAQGSLLYRTTWKFLVVCCRHLLHALPVFAEVVTAKALLFLVLLMH
jgi:hypothetical protein